MSQGKRKQPISEREAVFMAWDDMHADLPAEHDGLDLDDTEVLREVARRAKHLRGRFDRKFWEIRNFLTDSKRWSPVIDQVAIDRAIDFQPGALEALTRDERHEFVAQLAVMDDPWDGDYDWRSAIRKASHIQGAPVAVTPSARRMRYTALPQETRDWLKGATAGWRRNRKAARTAQGAAAA